MISIDGGPAFPVPIATGSDGVIYNTMEQSAGKLGGMSLRQYAAIQLRVPYSGTEWLDEMIRRSLWDKFAGQALVGWLAGLPADSYAPPESTAKQVYEYADAMLRAREQSE